MKFSHSYSEFHGFIFGTNIVIVIILRMEASVLEMSFFYIKCLLVYVYINVCPCVISKAKLIAIGRQDPLP